jgi:hypothetical protein
VDGLNGVYAYGASSSFPSNSWNDSNYWVDVIFVTDLSIDHFTIETISSPKYATLPFNITITARDAAGNVAGWYHGQASLSASNGTITPLTTGNFVNGVWSGPVVITNQASGVTITASDGGTVGTSNSFDVIAPISGLYSIWSPDATVGPEASDAGAVELGVKFRASTDGDIIGLRFYKYAANTGTHTGNLWTLGGTNLGTLIFDNETASGWQEAYFATPIRIHADATYVASYHTPSGHYARSQNYFTTSGVDNPPLYALQSGVAGSNGVYRYSTTSGFPNLSYADTNYWVDVLFAPAIPTAVTLASFTAEAEAGQIALRWETVSEIDTLGFHVYRSQSPAGSRARLNGELMPCQTPPGSPTGAVYTWLDGAVEPGVPYYYWLEDVSIQGRRTLHGPVSAAVSLFSPYRLFLPLVTR